MVIELTINDLIKKGMNILKEGDFNNPLLDIELILMNLLNVNKAYIYTHREQVVNKEIVDKYDELVDKRKNGCPVEYLINKQEFMGLDFYVNRNVLIPRPDTEILVEYIIDFAKNNLLKKDKINIVDIGTGSGAITLSLAHYIKNSFIYSVDISEDALNVAKENCKRFKLNDKVKFLHGNVFEPLQRYDLQGKIDIIVSNPPYIPSYEINELQIEVSSYEPRLALDGGDDGLKFYRQIIDEASLYLAYNGLITFEIGYNQAKDVTEYLKKNGRFMDINLIKDLAGRDRVITGINLSK